MAEIRIVVDINGGLVQGIYADIRPSRDPSLLVVVADYDTEGAEESELFQVKAGESFAATYWVPTISKAATAYVEEVFTLLSEEEQASAKRP